MTAKSIIDVEVNDAAFKEFQALFSKYQTALNKTPTAWANVNKNIDKGAQNARNIDDSFQRAAKGLDKNAQVMKKFEKASASVDNKWKSIGKKMKEAAGFISGLLKSLLKIAGIGGIFGGLLGAGGLFGLSRLASAAAGQQRSARGLNLRPGEQKAFGVNFSPYVDSDAYLARVNEAMHDQSKRWTLLSAGLTEGQMQGKNTAQVGAMLLPLLRQRFIQGGKTQQGADAFGLSQFADLQDLSRLANTSPEELKTAQQQYEIDKKNLALSEEVTRAWTKLLQQIDRAGGEIEKIFITSLSPLAPQLAKLSSAFADAIKIIASNPEIKKWIGDLGDDIKKFATYIGSEEFKQDVSDFTTAISQLARKTVAALKWLGLIPDKEVEKKKQQEFDNEVKTGAVKHRAEFSYGWGPGYTSVWNDEFSKKWQEAQNRERLDANHNPGNIRKWGNLPVSNGFAVFPNVDAGIGAMAKQLQLYGKRGNDTISGMIGTYAPPGDRNNTQAYIDDIAKRTGYDPTKHLNLGDRTVLANLVAAMTKHENANSNFSSSNVQTILAKQGIGASSGARVEIYNNTGGAALVSLNQLAQ